MFFGLVFILWRRKLSLLFAFYYTKTIINFKYTKPKNVKILKMSNYNMAAVWAKLIRAQSDKILIRPFENFFSLFVFANIYFYSGNTLRQKTSEKLHLFNINKLLWILSG